ncbi:MAG: hypothetical protein Kow0042_05250 [Calditrichia bacterium]
MWKKYFFISLAFNGIVILSFVFFTFVHPYLTGSASGKEKNYTHPLTATQQARIDSLKTELKAAIEPLRIKVMENRLQLWKLLLQKELNSDSLQQTIQQMLADEQQLRQVHFYYYIQEKSILTPQQRVEQIQPFYDNLKSRLEVLKEKIPEE